MLQRCALTLGSHRWWVDLPHQQSWTNGVYHVQRQLCRSQTGMLEDSLLASGREPSARMWGKDSTRSSASTCGLIFHKKNPMSGTKRLYFGIWTFWQRSEVQCCFVHAINIYIYIYIRLLIYIYIVYIYIFVPCYLFKYNIYIHSASCICIQGLRLRRRQLNLTAKDRALIMYDQASAHMSQKYIQIQKKWSEQHNCEALVKLKNGNILFIYIYQYIKWFLKTIYIYGWNITDTFMDLYIYICISRLIFV